MLSVRRWLLPKMSESAAVGSPPVIARTVAVIGVDDRMVAGTIPLLVRGQSRYESQRAARLMGGALLQPAVGDRRALLEPQDRERTSWGAAVKCGWA